MKHFALGFSLASIAFFVTLGAAGQNPIPAPNTAETAQPPPPARSSADASGQPAPVVTPNSATPNSATPNQAPQTPAPIAPFPTNPPPFPNYPYGNSPYGYPPPYSGDGWGMPNEPPKELVYNGGPIPYGYKYEQRYNWGLLISGPTLFALGYAIAAVTASEKTGVDLIDPSLDKRPWNTLYIPIAGPFAFSAYAPEGSAFIYVFEGVAQLCGVGLFLGGILRPRDVLIRKSTIEAFDPTLRIGPGRMQLEMHF